MSIFSKRKPKEESPMTSYTPMPEYQQPQGEQVIGGIQRAVEAMPNMIYGSQEMAMPNKPPVQPIQTQAPQPAMHQPQPIQQNPPAMQTQDKLSTDAVINAFNELDQRIAAIEAILFRRGLYG